MPETLVDHLEYWRYQWPKPQSFVYVIKADGDSPIKVGKSDDHAKRLDSLQTGNPRRLRLLHVLVGGLDLEWQLHQMLKDHRMVGEWFDGPKVPEFLVFVADLADRMLQWHEENGKETLPDYRDFGDWEKPPGERRRRRTMRTRTRRVSHIR